MITLVSSILRTTNFQICSVPFGPSGTLHHRKVLPVSCMKSSGCQIELIGSTMVLLGSTLQASYSSTVGKKFSHLPR